MQAVLTVSLHEAALGSEREVQVRLCRPGRLQARAAAGQAGCFPPLLPEGPGCAWGRGCHLVQGDCLQGPLECCP